MADVTDTQDVRERIARAMYETGGKTPDFLSEDVPDPVRVKARMCADAALSTLRLSDHIAAVEAAGYIVRKPHDWGEDPDPVRRSLEYPQLAMQCRRCGRRNTDLGGGGSCDAE
jgi:hypothetical protein